MKEKIMIKNVSKEYKNQVKALDNISLTIGSGVFGLLGHNGAGKTTLMKGITTILSPSQGSISVCGFDTKQQSAKVREMIGYLPQELNMYSNLSVIDFVSYIAQLKGIHDIKNVKEVLKKVDMIEFANRKIGQLSGGMKRRVGIAQAILGNPDVLIVDEPTAGLDPEERVRFRSILSQYTRDGKTVILSTHIVEDVYQICEHLAVLRKGKLFFSGTSDQLIGTVKNKVKAMTINNDDELVELQKSVVVLSTNYEQNSIIVKFVDENNGYLDVETISATLEDAYVYSMGGKRE